MKLRHRHIRPRVAIERHQFLKRAVADDDAGGMGAGVAVEAFQLQGDIEQSCDLLVTVAGVLKLGFAGDCVTQIDRVRRIGRHKFRQAVDLAIGHFQHPPDIAHNRSGL